MSKNLRDFSIFIFVVYAFSVAVWIRMYPEAIGEWMAKRDIAYDSVWGEYIMDCDCTEPLE